MITARSYVDGDIKELDPADISEVIDDPDRLLWVDLVDASDDDLDCMQQEFSLHPLAIEDVQHRHQRPKLEQYPSHFFLVAYTSDLQEVDFFLGPNWMVSVRAGDDGGPAWPIDAVRERFERVRPSRPSSAFLLYVALDTIVDGYFDATDKSEDALEELEDRIFAEQVTDEGEIQQELFDVRRNLLLFRRAVAPLREVLAALLRGEVEWLDETTRTHLQDVYDHVLRAMEQLDGQRELMGNAVEAHLAIISNRMNSVMKRMTSWGAILLGATLVAGIYGMNFEHMPELDWQLGYPFALAIMATITIVGYRYFRRKDWL